MKNLLYLLWLLSGSVYGQTQFERDSIKVHQLLGKGGEKARNANYDSANYYYAEAEALSREMDYLHGIISSKLGYGLVHHFKKEPQQALDFYLQAEALIPQGINPKHLDVERLYNNLGGVYIDLGYRLKARNYLLKALELKEANQTSDLSSAITHYNLGLIYLYFGENESALDNFMIAYPTYLEHYGENGARVAQLYTNIGNIHDRMGNIAQAEQYYQRGIAIHMENHGAGYWNLAYPYSSLGSLYLKTNRRQQGLNYLLRSLDLCRSNPNELVRLEALNLGSLAKYFLEEKAYENSRDHAKQAVSIMQETFYPEHPRVSEFYTIIGQTYLQQGDMELAHNWFENAREIVIQAYGEHHPQLAMLYLEQSRAYLQIQRNVKAILAAQKALKALSDTFSSMDPHSNPSVKEVLSVTLLVDIISHKGDIFRGHASQVNRQENLLSALEQYRQAVAIIDYKRRGFVSEDAKLFLQSHAHEVYQKGIEVSYQLYSLNQSEEHLPTAFFFMEKSKASILSEALQASNPTSIEGVDSQLLQHEMALTRQVKSLELRLADALIEHSDSSIQQLKTALFHAKTRIDSLAQVIRTSHPNYYQLKYNTEVLALDQAREVLPDEGIALSFFEATDSWYLLGLGDVSTFHKIPKSQLSNQQIEVYLQDIGNPETSLDSVVTHGYEIYQQLLAETLDQHAGAKQLIIVPDGMLHYLPFDALVTTQDQDKKLMSLPRYVLQNYRISYLNSITLHASLKKKGSYQQKYVGFAPAYQDIEDQPSLSDSLMPLKGARSEVERAGEMFKGKRYLDQQASEYEFKNQVSSSSILHLAMHALVHDEDPLRSQLLFSPDTVDDGQLHAYEIYQLRLNAELAVLSACNTGIGKISKGEGVMSLSRAFMYAGCPNIVMSLWQVKDQPSSQIMYTFFENLKKGLPKDESLQQAKIRYLSTADPYQAHPANWAAFVLLGDYHPLSRPNNPWLWIGLTALFAVLGVLYYRQRQKRKRMIEKAMREEGNG